MPRYEMHVHTAECDIGAQLGGAELVRRYQQAGYDGMVVTDHYFSWFLEWFANEIAGCFHKEIIQRWLRGYDNARNEGEKLGFTVLPGAEVRFDGNINDYLVYGLDDTFFYKAPLLNRLNGLEELISIVPRDVCIVQAHPFRDKMTVQNPASLFGIEVFNAGTEHYRNHMAKEFAEYYGKAMLSGSDCHGHITLGRGGIITESKITTPAELISILRNGKYDLIDNGEVL